jgi:cytochrome c
VQVSQKYINDKNAVGYLANKIITGGGGVWGEHAMNAHPQFSKEDASEIVKYVLTVSTKQEDKSLPQSGDIVLNEHMAGADEGRYLLTASYTDKGGAITPLTNKDVLILRPSKVEAESADFIYNMQKNDRGLGRINSRSYFVFKNIDLKDVNNLVYSYSSEKGAVIEVHIDSLYGQVISNATFDTTSGRRNLKEATAPVSDHEGKHDLYFAFAKNDTSNKNLVSLDWIRFDGGKEVMTKQAVNKKKNQKIKAEAALKKGAPPQSESPSIPVRKPPTPGKTACNGFCKLWNGIDD